MATYQKPQLEIKKVKVNFFLTSMSFWDSFGSFGNVYAQSGGNNDQGGNASSSCGDCVDSGPPDPGSNSMS